MDYRLKRQCDFNEVFLKGKRAYSKSITIIYLEKKAAKVGISVGKKHGNAVKRNKLKRLVRAAVFPFLQSLKTYYVVILPKVGHEHSFGELSQDISYLLKKENLLDENPSVKNS